MAALRDIPKSFRLVVLPPGWLTDPWGPLVESDRPERWGARIPIVVLPEDPEKRDEVLGQWLKEHMQRRRNTVRFLLPREGSENLYRDAALIHLARAIVKASEWASQNPQYAKCKSKFQSEIRAILRQRFDRFAVLVTWNFAEPGRTRFRVESLSVQGERIPTAIEEVAARDLFVPEDFEALVLEAARNNQSLGRLLQDLEEPRPHEKPSIAWLGETVMVEKVYRLCAQGRIAINVRGLNLLQAGPGETPEAAWQRMKSQMVTGRHLDETQVLLPQAVPAAPGDGASPRPAASPRVDPGDGARGAIEPETREVPGGTSPFTLPGLVPHSSPATSALNLIGKVEGWGIRPTSTLREVRLRLRSASGAQLEQLLRSLPDGLTYELDLEEER